MNLATAIVVARANSVRLPNKALLPFAGTTLIGHKVRTLLRCKQVGRIVVGSDSDAILAEAARHGAMPVKRDDFHCDETRCSANEMIHDMVSRVPGADDETILWAHPTNPLVKPETYDRAIREFDLRGTGPYDSVVSIREEHRHAWFDGQPLNHDPWRGPHVAGAGLRPVGFQDGAIFIQTREMFLHTSAFYGACPKPLPIPWNEGWDVDTSEQLVIARALWDARCALPFSPVAPASAGTTPAPPSTSA
jgi:CMP-N-acetylneuraminic acid synthetase